MAKNTDSTVKSEDKDSDKGVDEETQDETLDEEETEDEDSEEETDETEDDSEDSEEEDDESDDDEDDEDSEDDEPEFQKKFTQIKGDTPEEYIPNLEDAYKNSSAEAIRLKQKADDLQKQVDAMGSLIAQNPDLAEKINKGEIPDPTVDPALLHARQSLEETMRGEYEAFADNHPELNTDEALQQRVLKRLGAISQAVRQDEGRIISMKEGLSLAWSSLGLDSNNKDEEIRMKSKDQAAASKNGGGSKKPSKSDRVEFTEAQITTALNMGLGKDRTEVIKKLKQYATK